jgi:RNA polymerase sigma factor (sigma-70 family)
MANRPLRLLVRHIQQMARVPTDAEASDSVLLTRFVVEHDEAAFAALLERHGPMVRGLCRRLLRQPAEVDDAFQATFLVLVHKAQAIRKRASLASWLYGVALRIARQLRRAADRPLPLEHPPARQAAADPGLEAAWHELCAVLDEEVQRLSEKFRAPLILCYLEGQTRDQAARQLGWSLRTLHRRLERGREMLRLRLTRRGLTLSAGLLATAVAEGGAQAAVPTNLLATTLRAALLSAAGKAATQAISSPVAALVRGVLRTMYCTKLIAFSSLAVIAAAVAGSGVFLAAGSLWGEQTPAEHALAHGGQARDDAVAGDQAGAQANGQRRRAEDLVQSAKDRAVNLAHLKRLALAMHNYFDTYGHFPAPAIYSGQAQEGGMAGMMAGGGGGATRPGTTGAGGGGPAGGMSQMMGGAMPGMGGGRRASPSFSGRALLSWRVALLPFLEQDALYKQFKLNEPWDSPHNKKLVAKMPAVYAGPQEAGKGNATGTRYQVFVGGGAAFEKHRGMQMPDIPDGTSNTILIVESARLVPWTRPEDLPFDPDLPLPDLGNPAEGSFNAAFCDGAVHTIKRSAGEDLIRAAITRAGGEVMDTNQLFEPRAERANVKVDRAGALAENRRLHEQLQEARNALDRLKTEVEATQGQRAPDKETLRLMEENARLREQIQRLRQETQELAEQLHQSKPVPGAPDR